MKLTIIADDKTVYIDGEAISGISMKDLPDDIHAVQFKGNKGHIEYKTEGKKNDKITEIDQFLPIINLFYAEKALIEAKANDPYYGMDAVSSKREATKYKLNLVDQEKARVRNQGVVVNGVLFDSDPNAMLAYLKFSSKADRNPNYKVDNWKASDGVWVRMTSTLLELVLDEIENVDNAIFLWAREKIQTIKDAPDKDSILSITTRYTEGS